MSHSPFSVAWHDGIKKRGLINNRVISEESREEQNLCKKGEGRPHWRPKAANQRAFLFTVQMDVHYFNTRAPAPQYSWTANSVFLFKMCHGVLGTG